MNFFKKLFTRAPKPDFTEIINRGGIIIDVRTSGEFQAGHIKKSKNIPLDRLPSTISKLKKDVPVITCCASGARSASARRILLSAGFKEVYNGGSWMNLRNL